MLAVDLISTVVFPLKKSDKVSDALGFMRDWKVFELPVVDEGQILGYCSWTELSEKPKSTKVIDCMSPLPLYTIDKFTHLFEIVKIFAENKHSVMPVTENGLYMGTLVVTDLIQAYRHSALSQPGAIIELQMPARNYSLAELSRLIESNDARILHLLIGIVADDSGHIKVTLKLNISEVRKVLYTLERYQYAVTGVYQANGEDEVFKSRFDNLIHYLNT